MRKLYLKIVLAIWMVMILASAGAVMVVRVITSAEPVPERSMGESPMERMLPTLVDRASAASRGQGADGLVAWFESDMPANRIPMVLQDADGNRLFQGGPPYDFDQAANSDDNGHVRRLAFVHDGVDYSLAVARPGRNGAGLPRPSALQRLIAMLAFRPGYTWLLLIIAIPLSVFLSIIIARYLVQPLSQFERAGRRLSEGDFSVRIGPLVETRRDEIADFAATFDQMASRIEELVRSHKELLRDVSHELRSPLARAQAALSLARQRTDGAVDPEMDRIEREIVRLDDLIGRLLDFARLDARDVSLKRESVDLGGLLADVVSDSVIEARTEDKQIALAETPCYEVSGDPELLASCFENIIRNAVRYTPVASSVDVSLCRAADEPGYCRVDVRDHGAGVPANELERIFDPFYKTDNARGPGPGGSGIGLAIAKKAAMLHEGEISAENAEDGGLIISVRLPLIS